MRRHEETRLDGSQRTALIDGQVMTRREYAAPRSAKQRSALGVDRVIDGETSRRGSRWERSRAVICAP
jgi:hypothetical protein